ncbi:MAG TPA: sugar phosphate isomerase/epimerase [Caldilineaceae bacterium]|nr:sugar phosphate isomerase/epimerase [Caldilineaceae bacterium]
MKIGYIGVAVGPGSGPRPLVQLEQNLDWMRSQGFRLVEVGVTGLRLIVNGALQAREVENFVAVLRNFDLRYSIHGPNRLNLAYDARHLLCKEIMRGLIEICRRAGSERLVYHSGLQALDAVRSGVRRSLLSGVELVKGARQEVVAFQELAPIAADAGVVIGMENGDSHLWEHNLMARFGLPGEALATHHARLYIPPIVRQLEAIDHPNVAMTLDIAHLHIAAHDMGFDYLAAVGEAAPWVRHLHVNDNFGLLDQGFESEAERLAFGEADLHLPPGWGTIPYAEVFARLPDYTGDLILEIKPGFIEYAAEGRQTIEHCLTPALVDQ